MLQKAHRPKHAGRIRPVFAAALRVYHHTCSAACGAMGPARSRRGGASPVARCHACRSPMRRNRCGGCIACSPRTLPDLAAQSCDCDNTNRSHASPELEARSAADAVDAPFVPPLLVWLGWPLPPLAAAYTPPAAVDVLTAPLAAEAPPDMHAVPRCQAMDRKKLMAMAGAPGEAAPAAVANEFVAAVAASCFAAAAALPAVLQRGRSWNLGALLAGLQKAWDQHACDCSTAVLGGVHAGCTGPLCVRRRRSHAPGSRSSCCRQPSGSRCRSAQDVDVMRGHRFVGSSVQALSWEITPAVAADCPAAAASAVAAALSPWRAAVHHATQQGHAFSSSPASKMQVYMHACHLLQQRQCGRMQRLQQQPLSWMRR